MIHTYKPKNIHCKVAYKMGEALGFLILIFVAVFLITFIYFLLSTLWQAIY